MHVAEGHDGADGSGAGEQDVGAGHGVGEVLQGECGGRGAGVAGDLGESLGALGGPVGDLDAGDAAAAEVGHGEAAHRARAQDHGVAAVEAAGRRGAGCGGRCRVAGTGVLRRHGGGAGLVEDLGGPVQRHRHHGGAGGVDAGLGVDALAHVEGLLGEPVQGRSGGADVGGRLVGGADLPDDLLLAHDHRVQARGHGEQVLGRRLRVAHVQMTAQFVHGEAGVLREQGHHVVERGVERLGRGVHLDAVAGGDDHRLVDVLAADQVLGQRVTVGFGDGHRLEQGDRRTVMGQSHQEDAHTRPPSARGRVPHAMIGASSSTRAARSVFPILAAGTPGTDN